MEETEHTNLIPYLRSKLKDDGGLTFALIGSSRSGKTTLLVEILEHVFDEDYVEGKKDRKPIIMILTTSPDADPLVNYRSELPVYPLGHTSQLVKQARGHNRKWKNKHQFVFVYDDVLELRHNRTLNQMILTDRNKDISSIISTQYPGVISKEARTNINFVFLLYMFGEGHEMIVEKFLRGHLPQEWSKRRMEEFYSFWTHKKQGRGFLINNLDNGVFFVDDQRSIFPLSEVVELFENVK